jgi:hypothetical protein
MHTYITNTHTHKIENFPKKKGGGIRHVVVWFIPVFPTFWRMNPKEKEFNFSKQKHLLSSGPACAIFEFQVRAHSKIV